MSVQSDELKNQIVKNLIFMINNLQKVNFEVKFEQMYRKLSFIGRKAMLDIKSASDRLETILEFYNVSI